MGSDVNYNSHGRIIPLRGDSAACTSIPRARRSPELTTFEQSGQILTVRQISVLAGQMTG